MKQCINCRHSAQYDDDLRVCHNGKIKHYTFSNETCNKWKPQDGKWISTEEALPEAGDQVLLPHSKIVFWYNAEMRCLSGKIGCIPTHIRLDMVKWWLRIPDDPEEYGRAELDYV